MKRLIPSSLLGQMLLAVAAALLAAQGVSAILLYRAHEARREAGAINALAFQLVVQPRPLAADRPEESRPERRWRRMMTERSAASPLRAGEQRDARREEQLRAILAEQGVAIGELVVTARPARADPFIQQRLEARSRWRGDDRWRSKDFIIAGLKRPGAEAWHVARVPVPRTEPRALGSLILQTLLLYIALVGGLAFLLRRITRPLAALTKRLERFAETRETGDPIEPSGPEDTRRLIAAHNAMETRIGALLDEKDVMLGAIGHDLKTPLAALRVRIESVADPAERERMARSIEDITGTLDDILSLARVGRPTDPLEQTDLAALAAGVADEFEDMGEPVTLVDGPKLAAPVRATWLRRALRNLVSNAVRYGNAAEISLAAEGAEAVLTVEDRGPGIPEADIARMTLPFVRGDGSRNRTTGGAGLGLTIARAIAEQHRGRLVLSNREGGGLRAQLRLPTSR